MAKKSDTKLTIDEYVAVLKNTSLPTLIVEGRDDMTFFQKLEELCFENKIDIMPTTGRNLLLELYKRKNEYKNSNVAFIADSDLFVFNGHPKEFKNIIFTTGYSIENDILSGGHAFKLIPNEHKEKWDEIISLFGKWFASVLQRISNNEQLSYKDGAGKIVDFGNNTFRNNYHSQILDVEKIEDHFKKAIENPKLFLRGHTLHDAFSIMLNEIKHKPVISKGAILLFDLIQWDKNTYLKKIIKSVKQKLGI